MWEWFVANASNIGVIAAFCTAVGVIVKSILSVKKAILKPLTEIKEVNAKQEERLKLQDADIADLLCSQLIRDHDYYVGRGWCPTSEKQRLDGVYTRYKARGRNHVATTYMDDIIALPSKPKN